MLPSVRQQVQQATAQDCIAQCPTCVVACVASCFLPCCFECFSSCVLHCFLVAPVRETPANCAYSTPRSPDDKRVRRGILGLLAPNPSQRDVVPYRYPKLLIRARRRPLGQSRSRALLITLPKGVRAVTVVEGKMQRTATNIRPLPQGTSRGFRAVRCASAPDEHSRWHRNRRSHYKAFARSGQASFRSCKPLTTEVSYDARDK